MSTVVRAGAHPCIHGCGTMLHPPTDNRRVFWLHEDGRSHDAIECAAAARRTIERLTKRIAELRTWATSRLEHHLSQDRTLDETSEERLLEAVLRIIERPLT